MSSRRSAALHSVQCQCNIKQKPLSCDCTAASTHGLLKDGPHQVLDQAGVIHLVLHATVKASGAWQIVHTYRQEFASACMTGRHMG
jgi:hypothetical protein